MRPDSRGSALHPRDRARAARLLVLPGSSGSPRACRSRPTGSIGVPVPDLDHPRQTGEFRSGIASRAFCGELVRPVHEANVFEGDPDGRLRTINRLGIVVLAAFEREGHVSFSIEELGHGAVDLLLQTRGRAGAGMASPKGAVGKTVADGAEHPALTGGRVHVHDGHGPRARLDCGPDGSEKVGLFLVLGRARGGGGTVAERVDPLPCPGPIQVPSSRSVARPPELHGCPARATTSPRTRDSLLPQVRGSTRASAFTPAGSLPCSPATKIRVGPGWGPGYGPPSTRSTSNPGAARAAPPGTPVSVSSVKTPLVTQPP